MTPERGVVTITHSYTDGTLVDSRPGDGVWDILRDLRTAWAPFRSLGCLGFRGSRGRAANRARIKEAADALRAAGYTVEVEIDETDRPSVADQYADRADAAADRAERFSGRADAARRAQSAAHARATQIAGRFEGGQPILKGHYTERSARRDKDRVYAAMDAGLAADRKAGYWDGRAAGAALATERVYQHDQYSRILRLGLAGNPPVITAGDTGVDWVTYTARTHTITLHWAVFQFDLPAVDYLITQGLVWATRPRGAKYGPEFRRRLISIVHLIEPQERLLTEQTTKRYVWMGEIQ